MAASSISIWRFIRHFMIYIAACIHRCSSVGEAIDSKQWADQYEREGCGHQVESLWIREVSASPFAGTPLMADVNADGSVDVVAVPFTEAIAVLEGESGEYLGKSVWPVQRLHSSVHASPIQYDIDGDGMLDLLICTTAGELFFYHADGTVMKHFSQVPPAFVLKDWHLKVMFASAANILDFVREDAVASHVSVDPHILATPVVADINRDDRVEELVIPVSYYYDEDEYRLPEQLRTKNLTYNNLGKYLVGGLVFLNLTSFEIIRTVYLQLSQFTAAFPGYVMFMPTVIDLDSNGGDMEVVIGTSAGNLYVVNSSGKVRAGFPVPLNTIHGEVTVADVNSDGQLELIAIDVSGNVLCVNRAGKTMWEAEISGTSSPGSGVADLNNDGSLEIIITTNHGDIFILNGSDGTVLPGWPQSVGSELFANAHISTFRGTHIITLAADGSLHIISSDLKCKSHVTIGESSLVEILSYDLVSHSFGPELLVATKDGTLLCFGLPLSSDHEDRGRSLPPAETLLSNDFTTISEQGIRFLVNGKDPIDITGNYFRVDFEIYSIQTDRIETFAVRIYYGSNILAKSVYKKPGKHSLDIPVWLEPSQGHMIIRMTNQHGQTFQDVIPVKFNKLILEDLQWLLISPFVAMVTILLVIHGFPAKDLLPLTQHDKVR